MYVRWLEHAVKCPAGGAFSWSLYFWSHARCSAPNVLVLRRRAGHASKASLAWSDSLESPMIDNMVDIMSHSHSTLLVTARAVATVQ